MEYRQRLRDIINQNQAVPLKKIRICEKYKVQKMDWSWSHGITRNVQCEDLNEQLLYRFFRITGRKQKTLSE